jgi:hypothetical protein
MRICDFIEELVVDNLLSKLTNEQKTEIIKTYDQSDWIRITKIFLNGIGNQHQVPGKQVYQLWNMCEQARYIELNKEQMWLLFHIILENWNQMSCESRANLML